MVEGLVYTVLGLLVFNLGIEYQRHREYKANIAFLKNQVSLIEKPKEKDKLLQQEVIAV